LTQVQVFGPGTSTEVNGPLPLYDVSTLPTDPATLAQVLDNENPGRTTLGTLPAGIKQLDYVSQCSTASCAFFERTVALLQGPDVGDTPALRQALFEVLATVPGVKSLGTITDRAGQSGLGLQLEESYPAGTLTIRCARGANGLDATGPLTDTPSGPSGGAGAGSGARSGTGSTSATWHVTWHHGASTTAFTIVVDPQTTSVLGAEEDFTPVTRPAPPDTCSSAPQTGRTEVMTPTWNMEVDSGIVGSDTAEPGGTVPSGTPSF
jgi:hypothetical protein